MTSDKFNKALCEKCGQPLFITKKECRDFIEKKMKEGYLACRCCGAKQIGNVQVGSKKR